VKTYLSVKQVCERLPVCKSLVYRLVKDGAIPSARLGGKILIPEDALIAILERSVEETPPLKSGSRPKPPDGKLDLW
jgi:excisionase family DNA binding protein